MSSRTSSSNFQPFNSEKPLEPEHTNCLPHNTTESAARIDLSQRTHSRVCNNADDISDMSAPISEAEPETTATALKTKTFS